MVNLQIANIKILSTAEKIAIYSLVIGIVSGVLSLLPSSLLGFSPGALAWLMPLTACMIICLTESNKNTFPLFIWVPWVLYTTLCFIVSSSPNAFQRLVMLHGAIIIGIAFSCLRPTNFLYEQFSKYIDYYFWLLFIMALSAAGIFSGQIYGSTGFAAGTISAALLANWYAAKYSIGEKIGLYYWGALCLVPFLCNTRTGMVAVALTLPFTFGPLSFKKRIIVILALVVLGAVAFQTERVQAKMFYSGQGGYSDLWAGLVDLATGSDYSDEVANNFANNGRKVIALELKDGLNKNYWTGNGSNSTEPISMEVAQIGHPHNDWLRIQYEYGMLGIIIFIATVLGQIYHLWQRRSFLPKRYSPLIYASIGSFMTMALFMTSDNILLYIAWFGNVQFAMLGLVYGIVERQRRGYG